MFIYSDQLRKKKKQPTNQIADIQKENNALQLSKGDEGERNAQVYLLFLLLKNCEVSKLTILKEGEGISLHVRMSLENYLQRVLQTFCPRHFAYLITAVLEVSHWNDCVHSQI